MARDGELHGIGGWLAFFLLTLGVITPIGTLISAAATADTSQMDPALLDRWPRVVAAEWALSGLTAALCWFSVYRFLKVRNWQTVRIGVATLLLMAFVAILVEPVLVSILLGVDTGAIYQNMGGQLARPIGYVTIWTAYLLRSTRVANTYPRDPLADDAQALGEIFE